MSEQNDNLSLDQLLEDDGFDLGGNVPDYDPFAQASDVFSGEAADAQDAEEVPSRDDPSGTIPFTPISNSGGDERQSDGKDAEDDGEQPETSTPVRPAQAPAKPSNVTAPDFNPLAAAVNQAEEQNVRAGAVGVLSRLPVFTYGSAKEDLADKTQTFEQLRIAKSEDFPELDDGKRVTWTMEYGTITRQVPKPKETVIHKLKGEIEASKEFLEMLKKQKEKKDALVCKVKPRITAQSKGVVSAYKGVFTNLEEAEQSGKAIQIVPGRDGRVYEIRCTEAGRFVVPATDIPELSEVSAGFFPALPRIPFPVICQVVGFFRYFMRERELEAMVQIYWDKLEEQYRIAVPKQFVGKAHVDARLDADDALDEDRYVCVADIHSHNSMPAKFSPTDDWDERMTRVYMVFGRLDAFFPEISARISCGRKRCRINPGSVIEGLPPDFPQEWTARVETVGQSRSFWSKGVTEE